MAQLICPSCGEAAPAGERICPNCIVRIPEAASAAPADATEQTPVVASERLAAFLGQVPAPAPSPAPAADVPRAAGRSDCTDPDCVHGGRVPAGRCSSCGRRGSAAPLVRFRKSGESAILQTEAIPAGETLRVGRVDSPLAQPLVPFGNISRRHAVITNDNGTLTITDTSSANGTFVNSTRIRPGERRTLRHGDTVRFASNLEAQVDLNGGSC